MIAGKVWDALGADAPNYVEPFFGSGAVLLARPDFDPLTVGYETINDIDGFVANFWRALQHDPEAVSHYADWPVNENDLSARHAWLVREHLDKLQPRLEGDPDYYDAKVAGWWVWGMACWIGGGFCSGQGPWQSVEMDDGTRQLVNVKNGNTGMGVNRQLVHLGNAGRGVNRQLVHLGNAGRGGDAGTGEHGLLAWMVALAERMRRVRVCSGDWTRVLGNTPTVITATPTAVFLDPPYSAEAGRDGNIYAQDDLSVAHDVRRWAIEHGDDPRFRIALCGYDTEHGMPDNWTALAWKAKGGYGWQGNGAGKTNRHREVVWLSPHCEHVSAGHTQSTLSFLAAEQVTLLEAAD